MGRRTKDSAVELVRKKCGLILWINVRNNSKLGLRPYHMPGAVLELRILVKPILFSSPHPYTVASGLGTSWTPATSCHPLTVPWILRLNMLFHRAIEQADKVEDIPGASLPWLRASLHAVFPLHQPGAVWRSRQAHLPVPDGFPGEEIRKAAPEPESRISVY